MRTIDLFMSLKESRLSRLLGNQHWRPLNFNELPKKIWIYWDQGFECAPPVVQICAESWRLLNPGWTIHFVEKNNLAEFANMSDLDNCDVPIQKFANLFRTRLLKAHGGVWCDATLLCTKPLDQWLPLMMQADCFMYSSPGPGRILANWFIASTPNGSIISQIEDFYTRYLTKPSPYKRLRSPPYFNFHYSVEYMVRTKPRFRKRFQTIPRISAYPQHHLHGRLVRQQAATQEFLDQISALPVHKLTWKDSIDHNELCKVAERLHPALAALSSAHGDAREAVVQAKTEGI